jgi:hypothetical protein
MTDNHDQAMTLGPTRVETRAHKLRTNALPLVLRQYGHWRKTDRRLSWLHIPDLHRREENMTDDLCFDGRDEGNRIR